MAERGEKPYKIIDSILGSRPSDAAMVKRYIDSDEDPKLILLRLVCIAILNAGVAWEDAQTVQPPPTSVDDL